jgi:hypothetical protein
MSKKVIVIRLPLIKTIILTIVITVFAVMGRLAWSVLFAEHFSYESVSVSPDGMYKCILMEGHGGLDTPLARIKVYKYNNPPAAGNARLCRWNLIKEERITYDSVGGSPYVSWKYNDSRQTTKLTIWNTRYEPPDIDLEMFFDPEG